MCIRDRLRAPLLGETDEEEPDARKPAAAGAPRGPGDAAATEAEEAVAAAAPREEYGMGRLLALVAPHRATMVAACCALCVRLPFSLAGPHFVAETIGALSRGGGPDGGAAWRDIAALLACGTTDAALDLGTFFLFGLAQQKLIRGLRCDLFAAVLEQDAGFFDRESTGEVTSRLTADCETMANELTFVFRFSIESSVRIGGIVGYMAARSPKLSLVAFAIIPVVCLCSKRYGRVQRANQVRVQTALAAANSSALEALSLIHI